MKITTHTTEHLIIEDRPVIPALIISFLLVGLLTASVMVFFQQNYSRLLWTLLGMVGCLGLSGFLKVVRFDFQCSPRQLSIENYGRCFPSIENCYQ